MRKGNRVSKRNRERLLIDHGLPVADFLLPVLCLYAAHPDPGLPITSLDL